MAMKEIYNLLFSFCMIFIVMPLDDAKSQDGGMGYLKTFFRNTAKPFLGLPSITPGNLLILPDGSNGTTSRHAISNSRLPIHSIIPYAGTDTSGVLALVESDHKYGFIDSNGREVVPVRYESIGQDFYEGLVAVKWNGKWGFVDKKGREVVPAMYDVVEDFCEGRALVGIGNKYGYINREGHLVIPIRFDGAGSFHKGRAMVLLQGKRGFIDKNGNEVIPLKYDFVFDFTTPRYDRP